MPFCYGNRAGWLHGVYMVALHGRDNAFLGPYIEKL